MGVCCIPCSDWSHLSQLGRWFLSVILIRFELMTIRGVGIMAKAIHICMLRQHVRGGARTTLPVPAFRGTSYAQTGRGPYLV